MIAHSRKCAFGSQCRCNLSLGKIKSKLTHIANDVPMKLKVGIDFHEHGFQPWIGKNFTTSIDDLVLYPIDIDLDVGWHRHHALFHQKIQGGGVATL